MILTRKTPLSRKRKRPRTIKPGRVEDPAHLKHVRALPCCICGDTPSEAHHVRSRVGMGQRAGDHETIPLCSYHHRTGPFGVAFHAGPRQWELLHGPQRDFLAQTLSLLQENL